MRFIVCLYFSLQIVQNYASMYNPELLSSYPFKDKYAKFSKYADVDLDANCPGFECNSSGLNAMQITDIINKENSIRDAYAIEKNITNMYSVHWNSLLAAHAQERNHLSCILPPTGNKVIYEQVTNKWYTEKYNQWKSQNNYSFEDYPTAVEVVIGSRAFPIKDRVDLQHTITEFIEMFNKIDNISNPLERRGGTVDMGCSYLVTANTTHNTDYMVCLYGFLYFDPNTTANKYNNEIGTPCSRCTFYSVLEEVPEGHGSKRWTCDSRYPHTCNLSKRNAYDNLVSSNQFDCDRKALNKLKKPFLPSGVGLLDISTHKPIPKLKIGSGAGGVRIVPTLNGVSLIAVVVLMFKTL